MFDRTLMFDCFGTTGAASRGIVTDAGVIEDVVSGMGVLCNPIEDEATASATRAA